MECTICCTSFSSRGQATCASCARALVYQARLDRLTHLLASESLRNQVAHAVVSDSPSLPQGAALVNTTECTKTHAHNQVLDETRAIQVRCSLVDEQLRLLRQQMDQATRDNAARRLALKQRRTDVVREKSELASRIPQLLDPLQATVRRSERRLDKMHARTVEGRAKLCQETARLASLQQRRKRLPDANITHDYTIGGIPIVHLHDLNSAPPNLISASLANVCRLLATCCHYLSVRLPAEITPPHADYPHPTIFSLQSSYQGYQLPFPASSSAASTSNASRLPHHRSLPKPRLLYLDRPLVALAKEDPARYNSFIEGVALLAWNVAWLCTSQGLEVAATDQSISPMGKNLYFLFREHTSRNITAQSVNTDHHVAPKVTRFGQFSHADVHRNLATSQGAEVMRDWRNASFTRFLDKLKQTLVHEMSGAEWEVIQGDEFDGVAEDEEAVLVGGSRPPRPVQSPSASQSKRAPEPLSSTADDGNKGYLKVKSRTGEDN